MMIVPLDLLSDLLGRLSGSIGGLPTIAVMAVPFIVGLIVGFLVKKVLKWAIIAGVIVVVVAYFGFFGLSLSALGDLATQYGPMAAQGAIMLFGLLPLGLGFLLGLILGFIFG
ncbi:MAG: hypothetical protein NWF05_00790 [Candidatus Bathyarchaeota archaeon]|nr:hypothetical protein [Candidatus Bathyarchaeota archaeon]